MHGAIGMAKGRKRNAMAHRTAAGRPTRAGQEREFPPAQVKRLRDAAMSGLRDPEWGTELGRLYLEGAINHSMYAAGKRWREWAADYRQAIGAFPVRSASLQAGRTGSPPDPDSDAGRKIAHREAEAAERFFAADAVLVRAEEHYPGVRALVRRVCEDNESPCGFAEFMRFRTGLMHLVSHWDLTNDANQFSGKNAR